MPAKKSTNCPRVEMLPAFLWTCPECGRDNFERSVVVELSPEEMQELRDDHAVQVWQQGDFLTCPDSVTCQGCRMEFATEHFRQADEEVE